MNFRLVCPICGAGLNKLNNSFICEKNHNYDAAKSGYVNLLLSSRKKPKIPGDNKAMISARRGFLDKGYYSALKNALCDTVLRYSHNQSVILDAGCGEGYYTANIKQSLIENNISADIIGVDISKFAADAAAKRRKDILFAAASVFHIPAADDSFDIITSLFAPYCGEEFRRILKKNGVMIMAVPAADHLFELKSAVYDEPYLNDVKEYELEGFEFIGCEKLRDIIRIESAADIQNLFMMTPYYYKTGESGHKKLLGINSLDTTVSFEILTYLNMK